MVLVGRMLGLSQTASSISSMYLKLWVPSPLFLFLSSSCLSFVSSFCHLNFNCIQVTDWASLLLVALNFRAICILSHTAFFCYPSLLKFIRVLLTILNQPCNARVIQDVFLWNYIQFYLLFMLNYMYYFKSRLSGLL